MDWTGLRERTLGDVTTTLVTEGGGTAGGFIGGAFIGRQVQNLIKKDDAIVDITDKLLAWGGNNIPKLALWWMGRGYRPAGILGEAVQDGRKALAGSVVFDTLMRLSHTGKNPATASLWGYQVLGGEGSEGNTNQILQENATLRSELNKALQRLADMQVPGTEQYRQIYPRGMESAQPIPPEVAERQRKYGAMQVTPPAIQERERKYAFASPAQQAGFRELEEDGTKGSMAKLSGFL